MTLLAAAPLRPSRFFAALRPHLPYSLAAFVGTLAEMVQFHFSVYAVAVWATAREAGYLALPLQVFVMLRLFIAGRSSLLPVMAELDAGGESEGCAGGARWSATASRRRASWASRGRCSAPT